MGEGGRRPGPDIGRVGEVYAGGGRGVEIEMIEICRGGSTFGEATDSSTSGADVGIGTGADTGTGSGSISSSITGSGSGSGSGSSSGTGSCT